MHEHIKGSLLLGRRTKGNIAWRFRLLASSGRERLLERERVFSCFAGFRKGFPAENLVFRREGIAD